MLGKQDLLGADATQEYLLAQTQHVIGGFSKLIGDSPGWLASNLLNYQC